MPLGNVNQQHCAQIRAKTLLSLGKNAAIKGKNASFNWKPHVNYYPQDEAKAKFNADTAIHFSISLKDKEYFKGKYKYIKALFLQKNDSGFVNLYCLYTEEGKKNIHQYWKALETILRYDE
ncbi:hypothetical protein ABDK00_003070 [Niabella insulamsoli]|uniref:hypothetical protein n=1 Tax=Niabella insulamsoli TaxID=3144874 RepID=UPI0031FE2595